jgi:pimeloyl-ACP methyl ester carboxylesterase
MRLGYVVSLVCLASCLIFGSRAAAAVPDEKGYIATAEGVSIYFERYGSGPKTVIVPNRLFMPEVAAALARRDRTLILYDMRDRGLSRRVDDLAKLTIVGDVEDVEAMRRHFKAEKISLVGYSYLGLMVALYAAQNPERVERLVQIGPVPRKFGTEYPADQTAGAETLTAEGRAAGEAWLKLRDAAKPGDDQLALCRAQAAFTGYWLLGRPENRHKIPDTCVYENEWFFNAIRHLDASFGDIQKRDFPKAMFTGLSQPVLTVHGTMDRNAPYGSGVEWATTFRNGRLITVPGGAHQVWVDDPSVLVDIDQFLSGRWPKRAQSFGRE